MVFAALGRGRSPRCCCVLAFAIIAKPSSSLPFSPSDGETASCSDVHDFLLEVMLRSPGQGGCGVDHILVCDEATTLRSLREAHVERVLGSGSRSLSSQLLLA